MTATIITCPNCGGTFKSGEEHACPPKPREPQLWDLPIFGWAWREDAKSVERW